MNPIWTRFWVGLGPQGPNLGWVGLIGTLKPNNPTDIKIVLNAIFCSPHQGSRISFNLASTVGINPRLSDPLTPRTSKLGWRYFKANKIDRNKLQIRTIWQKGTGTKMAEKNEQFWKIWKKKDQISALFSTQTPPDDWPDAVDHLAIGLVNG